VWVFGHSCRQADQAATGRIEGGAIPEAAARTLPQLECQQVRQEPWSTHPLAIAKRRGTSLPMTWKQSGDWGGDDHARLFGPRRRRASSARRRQPTEASSESSESSAEDVAIERGAIPDVSTDAPFIDIFDAFALPDGPLGGCVACIRDRCGAQVNECANSDVCRAGLLCTLATCVSTGADASRTLLAGAGASWANFRAVLAATGSFSCNQFELRRRVPSPGATEGGTPGDGGSDTDGSSDAETSMDADVANDGD